MRKLKLLPLTLTIIGLFILNSVFSQENTYEITNNKNSQNEIQLLTKELKGIYQIQMIGIRSKPTIPQDLLIEIKQKQKKSERVYFDYKKNIKIMILSKDEIMKGEMISDDNYIIYKN